MTERFDIRPAGPLNATIRPPGSKSITNRALICAALADGRSQLSGALDSDDTRIMAQCLGRLGFNIDWDTASERIDIDGLGGRIPETTAQLNVGNSGTTARFLLPLLALGDGTYEVSGSERMHQRPMGELADVLNRLGSDVRSVASEQCLPMSFNAGGLLGGDVQLDLSRSSQFLSGLLMVAPYARGALTIRVVGGFVSQPYVAMTISMIERFGVCMTADMPQGLFHVEPGQQYRAVHFDIEPDATAASYFWAAAAIAGGTVAVSGLDASSIQGDIQFVQGLVQMGCKVEQHPHSIQVTGPALRGIDIDMQHCSDTAQTLAVVALFVRGDTRIRGIAHNRYKETDRIGNLAKELRRVGARVSEHEDGLTVHPGQLRPAEIQTYDDHRMAMSFSLAGLKQPGITILDPGCTAKTYPDFFADLQRLCQMRVT